MIFPILVLFVLVGGAVILITVQNFTAQYAHLALFAWQTPELPVGLLVLIAFLVGALFIYLISALTALRDASEMRRLRRRVAELEQQVVAQIPSVAAPPPSA